MSLVVCKFGGTSVASPERIKMVANKLIAKKKAGDDVVAAQRGAKLLRVHDVAATVDALKVWNAVAAVPAPRQDAASPGIRWPDDA